MPTGWAGWHRRLKGLLLGGLLLLVGPRAAGAPRDYLGELRTHLAAQRPEFLRDVDAGTSTAYIDAAYYLQGLESGAEASGDTVLMDELLGYLHRMLAHARPLVRDGVTYRQWGPFDEKGRPGQLATFTAAAPLARAAAIIARRPAFKARYRAEAAELTAFVDQSIFKYWFDKKTGVYADPGSPWPAGQIPWLAKDLGGWGTYDYFPQPAMHLGMIATWMYQATGNKRYLDAATRLGQGFRRCLAAEDGHWLWDVGKYAFERPDNQEGCQDTSHANRIPQMMLAMHEAGIVFTAADLDRLAHTFLEVIWNRSESSPMFSNYIDGSNKPYRAVATPGGNGIIYHGWAALGRHSPEVQHVVARTYDLIMARGGLNPSLQSNASGWALVELAGTLAWNDQGAALRAKVPESSMRP